MDILEAADIRLFREISHSLFHIERETDLRAKVRQFEELGAKLEFLARVMPELAATKSFADEMGGINRRIELAQDLLERLADKEREDRAGGEGWERD